jgi:hypothetical protein
MSTELPAMRWMKMHCFRPRDGSRLGPMSPRDKWYFERSFDRWRRRPDAYLDQPHAQVEIGHWLGFTFVSDPYVPEGSFKLVSH